MSKAASVPINYYHDLLIKFKFGESFTYELCATFILIVALLKLLYHMWIRYSKFIPESGLLVIIGLFLGVIIRFDSEKYHEIFNIEVFFSILLPLIIIDAGFFLPVKLIYQNCLPVFFFAFVGTLLTAVILAGITYATAKLTCLTNSKRCIEYGFDEYNFIKALLFGSIISAVDPVAVVAVFESFHVNEQLFSLVFGESLFNDGVAIVLFRIFELASTDKNINYSQLVVSGILSFLISSFFGVLVGIIIGLFGISLSKYTYHVQFIEPIAMIVIMYFSYTISETLLLSAIFASVTSVVVMKPYIVENISKSSVTALKYMIKISSQISEGAVFLLIGVINIIELKENSFEPIFLVVTIISTLLVRFIVVFVFTFLMNKFCLVRSERISYKNQFIMAYGGLRGAISLSLSLSMVVSVYTDGGEIQKLGYVLNNTTLLLVLFTIFFQGSTVQFFINCFNVKREEKSEYPLFESFNDVIISEAINAFDFVGSYSFSTIIAQKFRKFNDKYLRGALLIERKYSHDQQKIVTKYNKILKNEAELGSKTQLSIQESLNNAFTLLKEPINYKKHTIQYYGINNELDDHLKNLTRNVSSEFSGKLPYNSFKSEKTGDFPALQNIFPDNDFKDA